MSQPPEETGAPLVFLAADHAAQHRLGPFVVIAQTREEFLRWIHAPEPGLQWIEARGLLDDPEVWAAAAQGPSETPVDVILDDPANSFAALYRLVDARIVRRVRVTIPARPGFLKALRLAAAIQLPVRLLPDQPTAETLEELAEAARFYLRDPMVEMPVEPFHSLLGSLRGADTGTIWSALEIDPAVFVRPRGARLPGFVPEHLARLVDAGGECVGCRWQAPCAGFFKWPLPDYDCAGVRGVLDILATAADEIGRDLESNPSPSLP